MDPIFFTSAWLFVFIVLIMGVIISKIWGAQPQFIADATTGLTGEEKLVLHDTFNVLKTDMSGNGERLFVLYFESYPSNQDYFRDFRGKTLEELKGTPKFIAHGTNVICAMNGIVMHLNEPATLVEVVKKIGYSHGRRHIKPEAFTELKATILALLQEKLKTKYNQEVEEIWSKTLDIIMQVFQAGSQEYINDHQNDS